LLLVRFRIAPQNPKTPVKISQYFKLIRNNE